MPRKEGNVFGIIGQPGSGKTVLAYNIADAIHGERPVYCSMSKRYDRPIYYKPFKGRILDDSVVMGTDASIIYHAREWSSDRNIILSKIQSVRRHKNVDMIWDVQNSGDLDVTILRQMDALILKEPSILQGDYERPAMRKRFERADEVINQHGGWQLDNAYVVTHKREFVLEEIDLPTYWNEEISKDDLFRKGGWKIFRMRGEEFDKREEFGATS